MDYSELGDTGIKVSRMCFGTLTIGPLQRNLSVTDGAKILCRALKYGVNFLDTAEIYGTYAYIREAMALSKLRPVIATKSYAYTYQQAKDSIDKARNEMGVDMIDVFLLHEQESRKTLEGHGEALKCFLDAKEQGVIRAVGVSTHNIEVVEACADMPEIDVIHPIINKDGLGICDGNVHQMLQSVERARQNGKGIYSMKPLGGGNLSNDVIGSMKFVMDLPFIDSIAVGMCKEEEVDVNVRIFCNKSIPKRLRSVLEKTDKKLHIEKWCIGCGRCIETCGQAALSFDGEKICVDHSKCILCGYCSRVCPEIAIRVH